MSINPSDFRYAIVKEVTAGTTPATPTFLVFPFESSTQLDLTHDSVTSPLVRSSRASDGMRKVNFRVEGSLKGQLFRSTVIDTLLESSLSGAFATNVLKASNVDTNFTVEKTFYNGATAYYHRFTGCQVSKFGLTAGTDTNAEITFDVLGLDRTNATTAIASSTYTQPSNTLRLAGIDLNGVTVDGLSNVACTSIELSVEHEREAQGQMGATSAFAIGTGGIRKVTLTMKVYRIDLSPDTLMAKSDTPIAVSFKIGTAAEGWQFDIPAANYEAPKDEIDNSKDLVNLTFTAKYDNTAGTDLIITKLS